MWFWLHILTPNTAVSHLFVYILEKTQLFVYISGEQIKAEHFEGFKDDTKAMKKWPLRAWTDSAYNKTKYIMMNIPKLGNHLVAMVTLKDENIINLRFPMLSSDRESKFKT